MSELSLNGIIDVSVQLNSTVSYQRGFNTALLLGPYNEISGMEDDDIKFYESISELVNDFGTDTSVYKAASMYFGQEAKPKGVYVGCAKQGESLTQAITRTREANSEWYVCVPTDVLMESQTQSTITNAASYVESCEPASMLALTLFDSSTYLATMTVLNDAKYQRTMSMYDGLHDEDGANEGLTLIAGIIGYALGKNVVLSNTYTLAYKSIKGGVANGDLSSSELSAILAVNGNVYVKQGYYYDLFRQGKMASGDSFDEIIYIDMMVDQLKAAVMNLLISSAKIPQTEGGLAIIISVLNKVLEDFRTIGFVAEGVWNGQTVLALETGDTLPNGYLVQFQSIASQSPSDRAKRIAPPCYICVKLSGAIEHITIALVIDK